MAQGVVGLSDIGVIGLGVMGANLARNMANHKISTVVFNRTSSKMETFIAEHGNSHLEGSVHLEGLVESLEKPRKIILMVPAGQAVDEIIDQLTPLLSKDDIIIDGGNSFYKDTERRFKVLQKKGIEFVGCGISGGEEGALNGPSLMPGGSNKAWKVLKPILEQIAAKDFKGKPCVTYVGEGASGHYVKMVHNGIEYGVMQLMAETYDMLRNLYGLKAPEIGAIFAKFNKGNLQSYLFEIAGKVLVKKDGKGYMVDKILDVAGQKGTGSWTSHEALFSMVPLPTITEAVFARFISAYKPVRTSLQKVYSITKVQPDIDLNDFLEVLEVALYGALVSTYAQGYDLLCQADKVNGWGLNLAEISRIWQGGCIIRADLLVFLEKAYGGMKDAKEKHLFEVPVVVTTLKYSMPRLRALVAFSSQMAVPVSAFSSALSYFDMVTRAESPANFIQGLRDYFGAHTYQRIDKKGVFHTDWENAE